MVWWVSRPYKKVVRLHAINVPSSRLSDLPLRSIREIVPEVVGFHDIARGRPPVAESPPAGMLKGLGLCA